MNQSSIALATAVIISIVYLGLAVAAYQHLLPEPRSKEMQRLLAFTLWWPFYDMYGPRAKRLRIAGAIMFLLGIGSYVASAWLA